MADKSAIEWTDATWNPIRGCSRVSEGCRHCYAETIAARFSKPGMPYEGLARIVETPSGKEARWTNEIAYAGDTTLLQPTRWTRPRRIFVNSMSDLFHENVPDQIIDRAFAVMALCPQHTFQILTKRPERMRSYTNRPDVTRRIHELACDLVNEFAINVVLIPPGVDPTRAPSGQKVHLGTWPLANVWLGVSIEDQVTAETRIPYLLQATAALRFLSCEPLLGPLDLGAFGLGVHHHPDNQDSPQLRALLRAIRANVHQGRIIDWVIAGGESGPAARPMHPNWVRNLRDQCAGAGVPFFFKQWGEWAPAHFGTKPDNSHVLYQDEKVAEFNSWTTPVFDQDATEGLNWRKLGKTRSGRMLDNHSHDDFPEANHG